MTRALLILSDKAKRAKAIDWINRLPDFTRVEFKKPRRSIPQNDLLWAMLTDISTQVEWHGRRYPPEDWKDYMMHALRRARWMPNEEGGLVPVGMRTSDLSREEFSDLLELIREFGARNNVSFKDDKEAA